MIAAASEQVNELLGLCREGKLYEIEKWIADGKSIQVPSQLRTSPLRIAIEKGFHSLAELLLKNGVDSQANGNALYFAICHRKLGIVELLLNHGADIHSVCFSCVCSAGMPELVRMFIDRGADFVTDSPIAHALVKTDKALLGIVKEYLPKHPEIQQQVDMALRAFCDHGRMRGVALLLWLGANPRARVPELDRHYDLELSALEEAVSNGRVEIVKKFGLDPAKDDLNHLLHQAGLSPDLNMIRLLMEAGAGLNTSREHGQSFLEHCIGSLNCDVRFTLFRSSDNSGRANEALKKISSIVELGAKWEPQDSDGFSTLRTILYRADGYHVFKFAKHLKRAFPNKSRS